MEVKAQASLFQKERAGAPLCENRRKDPLASLPDEYWHTEDINHFMERATPWIMAYCSSRLNRDPDIVGDFYLHFYGKAACCLQKYRSRTQIPFTGFLATFLKNEFYNFIRNYRRRLVFENLSPDLNHRADAAMGGRDPLEEQPPEDAVTLVAGWIAGVPLLYRLPTKLYYGIELEGEEIREVAGLLSSSEEMVHFLKDYDERRDRIRNRLQQLQNRSAYLNHLIHSAEKREIIPGRIETYRRWKKNTELRLSKSHAVYSLTELGRLFRVSKSTIARRMSKCLGLLSLETRKSPPQINTRPPTHLTLRREHL